MSLLAGFDFAAELSNAAVLRFMQTVSLPGGLSLAVPFDLTAGDLTSAGAHFLFTDVAIDLLQTGSTSYVQIAMTFADTQITVPQGSGTVSFANAAGTLTFQLPLLFVTPTGASSPATLTARFGAIAQHTLSLVFSNPSAFQPPLPAGVEPMNVANLVALVGILPQLHAVGDIGLGVSFPIVAAGSGDGSLSPNLSFLDVHVVHVPNSDRTQQALVVLGTLVSESVGQGVPAQKTTTAITAGHDFAISLSPAAFKKLLFCPAVATQFAGGNVASLPTSCGGASSLSIQGLDVTSIAATFGATGVSVDVAGSHTAAEYVADLTVHGQMAFAAQGSSVNATVHFDDPVINITVAWWDVVGSILTGLIWGVVSLIVDGVNGDLSGSTSQLADVLVSTLLPPLPGLTLDLDTASATAEGLTLEGTIPYTAPEAVMPWLELSGSVLTHLPRAVASSGQFSTTSGCPIGTYPYTEYDQIQNLTYEAVGHLLGTPLEVAWSVIADDYSVHPLTGTTGTISFTQQRCYYVRPIPGGSLPIAQTVSLSYEINGASLQLTNRAADGNYSIGLHARAVSPAGTVVEAATMISVQGDALEIGGTWSQDVASCVAGLAGRLRGSQQQWQMHQPSLRWQPVDHPEPGQILSMINAILATGAKDAVEVAQRALVAHGASGYEALFTSLRSAGGPAARLTPAEQHTFVAAFASLVKR
jgi:hypothetical protein